MAEGRSWRERGIQVLNAAAEQRLALTIDPRVRVEVVLHLSHTQPDLRRDPSPPQNSKQDQAVFEACRLERVEDRNGLNQLSRAFDVDPRLSPPVATCSSQPGDEGVHRETAQPDFNGNGEGHRFPDDHEVAE